MLSGEGREVGVAQLQRCSRDVLLEVLQAAGSGDRHHDWAAPEHPGERHLRRRRCELLGDGVERTTLARQLAGGERVPRNEADLLFRAVADHRLARAVGNVVEVLDRRYPKEFPRCLDLLDVDFAQTEMADEPFLLHLRHYAELLVAGNLRIDAMELPQIDPISLQPAQAHQHALPQVLRATERDPDVRAVPGETSLR